MKRALQPHCRICIKTIRKDPLVVCAVVCGTQRLKTIYESKWYNGEDLEKAYRDAENWARNNAHVSVRVPPEWKKHDNVPVILQLRQLGDDGPLFAVVKTGKGRILYTSNEYSEAEVSRAIDEATTWAIEQQYYRHTVLPWEERVKVRAIAVLYYARPAPQNREWYVEVRYREWTSPIYRTGNYHYTRIEEAYAAAIAWMDQKGYKNRERIQRRRSKQFRPAYCLVMRQEGETTHRVVIHDSYTKQELYSTLPYPDQDEELARLDAKEWAERNAYEIQAEPMAPDAPPRVYYRIRLYRTPGGETVFSTVIDERTDRRWYVGFEYPVHKEDQALLDAIAWAVSHRKDYEIDPPAKRSSRPRGQQSGVIKTEIVVRPGPGNGVCAILRYHGKHVAIFTSKNYEAGHEEAAVSEARRWARAQGYDIARVGWTPPKGDKS